MKKAFFFDVDDTLCATGDLHAHAFAQAIQELKIDAPKFSYIDYAGLRTEEVFRDLGCKNEQITVASKLKREIFRSSVSKIRPTEGAREVLEFLLLKQKKIFAVSTGSFGSVQASLQTAGLLDYFEDVVTFERTNKTKPHPDPYLLAIKMSRCNPTECLAVEDSESGIQSALSAKLTTALIRGDSPVWRDKYQVQEFRNLIHLRESLETIK